MKKVFIFVSLLALTGCASSDYSKYAEIQIAKSHAEAERYKYMATIAQSGDTTTKVAAMFSLQQNSGNGQQQIMPPKGSWEIARELLGIFVPAIVQGYGIHANQVVSTTASNNATALGISTNQAFVGLASQIQAPQANITLSGTGVIGNGTLTTNSVGGTGAIGGNYTDQHNPLTNTNSYNPSDNHSNSYNPLTCTTGPC